MAPYWHKNTVKTQCFKCKKPATIVYYKWIMQPLRWLCPTIPKLKKAPVKQAKAL